MTNPTSLMTTWATSAFFQNPFSFYDPLRQMSKIVYLDPLKAWVILGFHECLAHAPNMPIPESPLDEETTMQLRQNTLRLLNHAVGLGRFDFVSQVAKPLMQQMAVNGIEDFRAITAHALINGLVALLHYPKQMAMLRANPTLISQAVGEMLRYDPPVMLWEIQPDTETFIENTPILIGESLYLCSTSANRDTRVYPNADVFDIMRRQPAPHLAFIGARHIEPFVHQILEIALGMTVKQIGHLRQCSEIVYQPTYIFRQVTELWLEAGT